MKENTYYKLPDGTVHKVEIYDETNKIVCITYTENPSQNKWVHESEYSTWVECDVNGNPIVLETVKVPTKKKKKIKKAPIKKAKNAAHKK